MRLLLTTRHRVLPMLLALGTAAACGTTVPVAQVAGDAPPRQSTGLDVPAEVLGPAPAAPGAGPAAGGIVSGPAGPVRTGGNGAARTGTGPTSGGQPAEAAGAGPVGRAADRRPVRVGILYTNNDAAEQFDVNNNTSFTPREAFEAFVAAWNARGGLAGRKIEPTYAELRSSSTTYAADLQAACERFTEDAQVAFVIGSSGIFFQSYAECLADRRTPMFSADYAMGDDIALRAASSVFTPTTITADARARVVLQRLTAAGRFTSKDKLGAVVEGCPFNERAYDRTVVPVAKRLGLTIAERFVSRCFEGIDDFGGLASDMQNAVLRFQTAGVTQVVLVSGGAEANMMLLFATAADAQGYQPGYGLTSGAIPAVQEANTPRSQLANAVGVGWAPALDTNRSATLRTARIAECVRDLQTGAGLAPASSADRFTAFSICDAFALADAVLRRTRGAADLTSIGSAVTSLRNSFLAATVVASRTDFSGGRRTAPAVGQLFAWSAECGCFDYTPAPQFSLLAG
ncbi:MAG TPA: ABC transporter substrate-binding protein [Mycobacteriales bacterium]|nr:ABC transporter substrate-binding protein [Mycobacteriales bacterium]